ncbi:MAG: Gfo/Idh/MocA family oxidoreductase [Firmicutes bacterium]|nr:Gfo/Idh/MocA family oxidoreductase [Bacillota bacterium]
MLRVGLIGIGFMGRGHLDNYLRLEEEGFPVKLTAICDIDPDKFKNIFVKGNIDVGTGTYDFSKYNLYSDMDEMLEKEKLDYVDIALPTYLHAEATVKALNKGIHVLCEKPMAMTSDECLEMVNAAKANERKLMVGQCLRFWPAYEYLKETVESKRFGEVVSGYFFRGGAPPRWSYQNWLLTKEKSGGCLLDQHIHDVDTINWLFGMPEKVSTIARNIIPGSGYDAVSTNYIYPDGKVINAQDDWTLEGDFGFDMVFRVNFEKGNLIFEKGVLTENPKDGKGFTPELSPDMGYYREIKYFANAILENKPIAVATPESTMETIRIAEAELESADNQGVLVKVE